MNAGEISPLELYMEEFVKRNLVSFDECRNFYEKMLPDELVREVDFLLAERTLLIPFKFTNKRYYAFFVSLVHCAANFRNLPDRQRTLLVDLAINLRQIMRKLTAVDQRGAFDKALAVTFDAVRRFDLFPVVSDLIENETRNYKGEFSVNPIGEILERADPSAGPSNDSST